MDATRFDQFAKAMSRRRLLPRLAALPLVMTFGFVPAGHESPTAAAKSCARQCQHKSNKHARRRCRHKCGAPGVCQQLDQFCGSVAGPCCGSMTCYGEPFSKCQYFCETTEQCKIAFPTIKNIECIASITKCGGKKCCVRT